MTINENEIEFDVTPNEFEIEFGSKSSGSGTVDYNELENKPSINGVRLIGNKTTKELGIEAGKEVHIGAKEPTGEEVVWIDITEEAEKFPTKTSELENDSGFITEIPEEYAKKTDIPDVSQFITMPRISKNTATATGITLENNTVYRFVNIVTNLGIALNYEGNELFQTELIFKSGTTATSLTYDESIKWSGDDIKDNVFVPIENKTYNILFWYDGFNINAVVRGV